MAQISGAVYRDFNEDGVRSFTAATPALGEIGVGGVTVNVYSSTGLVGTTTTSSATANVGSYTVTVSGAGPYRVEFVNLPSGFFDGRQGASSGTSVQFVTSSPATNVDLGINYPDDFCQPNPNFYIPCYVNGNSTGTGSSATQGVLVTLPYSSTGDSPSESTVAKNSEIGTVFGVAYQREAKKIFTAAFVKRHTGLGSGGAGAIYMTTPGSSTSTVFVTLPTAVTAVTTAGSTTVGSNSTRGLPANVGTLNYDATTFDQVGKAGLGDLEVSEDGSALYVVNLGDRKLYKIEVLNPTSSNPTAGTVTSYTLPAVSQATGSVFRPFALKYYRGRVYVGGVTTNEAVSTTISLGTGSTGGNTPLVVRDTTGMKAVVFEFDPVSTSFTAVLSSPLTYRKGASDNDQTGVSRADRWLPWTDVQPATGQIPNRFARNDLANCSYPQPMLTGIEFDVDGSMILSIRDRFGDQYGNNNYGTNSPSTQLYRAIAPGDILRAGKCNPAVNFWSLEYNARICGGIATAGASTTQGPGGGEYYYSDAVPVGDNGGPNGTFRPYHLEMSEGGLALLPGRDEVASNALDPTGNVDSGGIRRFKNSDGSGSASTSVQVYVSADVSTFGKANGLGDIELNCDLPPIQIGNRVWRDVNNNGVQDAGEPGLAGVPVVLKGPGATTVASLTTNASGEYYFSNVVSATTAVGYAYNLTLTSGTSYTLSFPTSVSAFSLSSLPNSATGTNANAIDSDADAAGTIAFTLGQAGENDFTFDVGYTCTPLALSLTSATICIGQTVSLTATSGFSSYSFSSGLTQVGTTNVASGTATGTYTVTATNSAGCSGTATGSITVSPLPVVTLSSVTICTGQTASLTATAGFASYVFSSGLTRIGTTNVASGTATGTYSVTVTNAAGCSNTATGSITVNPLPVVSMSSVTVCAGQTASLTATAGFASYVFSSGLTRIGTTNVASGTATGTYTVTATNSAGCSGTATGSITVSPLPVVSMSSVTVCAGQTASLTATAGFASYVFSSGLTQIGTTNVASGTATGTYTVTATNSAGCSGTATGSITVSPLPVVSMSSVTVCAGQTASLTATAGFASYVFSSGLTRIGTTNVASGTATGTYSVTVTNAAGCSNTATGSITVNPLPVVSMSSVTVCAGQTASLTATAGFASYVFSPGLTRIGTTNVASGTATGTYSVTVTNAAGCSNTATGKITVNPLPVVSMNSATICTGQTAVLTVTPGFASYTFSPGLTPLVGQPNVATTVTEDTYSVTVVSSAGCSATATGSVTVNPNAVVNMSSLTICAGQTFSLTATPGFASYVFSPGLTQVGTTNVASGTAAGAYSVTAIASGGCSGSATASITVNPPPVVSMSSATICAGETASLTATPGFQTYIFSPDLTQEGDSNIASGTTAGTYSVTAINTYGCSATATASITVNPLPVVSMNSATICTGQTAVLTVTPGFASYTFSPGLTPLVGQPNVATTVTEDTYSVTVVSSAGCSATATGSVTVNPNAVVNMSSVTICVGQTAMLTATPGFASYVFSPGLTQVGTTNVASGTAAGTYSVTAIASGGCSGTATASVTVNPLPTAVIVVSSATIAQGESATLTASGGSSYVWSTHEQTPTIVVTTADVYSVTVTTESGCSASTSTTITVNAVPELTINSATICSGESASLTVGGCVGGTIAWSTEESTTSILVSPELTTMYSVTCTFQGGAVSTTTTVTVNPLPSYTSLPLAVTATCNSAVANNDAHIDLTTLVNTERADIVAGSSYGNGPAYGAQTNRTVTAGAVSFTNLPNPATSQAYTIRLFNPGGSCYIDVTVILEPAICNCPPPKCVPIIVNRTKMVIR